MWAPGGLFGAIEECGKEEGNQREQRGLECDNKPSVLSGLWTTVVGGLALVTAPLCGGGGVEASLQERLLPLAAH